MSKGIESSEISLKTLENLKGSIDNRIRAIYHQAYKKGYEDGWQAKTDQVKSLLTGGWLLLGGDEESDDD